ncbi:MAG: hypothetical protein MK078_12330 [Crocinitomicaceae bacterium]|nr:hypothetical protein [Crocinitomicaceae bacterium]
MKPVIYLLEEQTHQTGSRIIKALADKLLKGVIEYDFTIRQLNLSRDFVNVFENEFGTLGFFCHEDDRYSPKRLIQFMEEEGCNMIFCTSTLKGSIKESYDALPFSAYVLKEVSSIFSPMVDIETLVDYRAEKLAERVEFYLDDLKDERSNNMRLRSMVI